MTRKLANPWLRLSLDTCNLGLEASAVIGLRTARIALGGPAAEAESGMMVAEKVEAAMALQAKALTGSLGVSPAAAVSRTLARYRRKVAANRRRLTRT